MGELVGVRGAATATHMLSMLQSSSGSPGAAMAAVVACMLTMQ